MWRLARRAVAGTAAAGAVLWSTTAAGVALANYRLYWTEGKEQQRELYRDVMFWSLLRLADSDMMKFFRADEVRVRRSELQFVRLRHEWQFFPQWYIPVGFIGVGLVRQPVLVPHPRR